MNLLLLATWIFFPGNVEKAFKHNSDRIQKKNLQKVTENIEGEKKENTNSNNSVTFLIFGQNLLSV